MTAPVPADILSRLKSVLGPQGWSTDPDRLAPKLVEWRDRWSGHTPLLALPKTTEEVSAVVGLCFEAGVAITPQGGNTGLVGGQIPLGEILLSTERMRDVRLVDTFDDVLIVEAGVTLSAVHEAAAAVHRRFPLGLASEGSATVGGIISTNAGGTQVLRYGSTRNLVLGLEAVLPNGEIWNGLKRLRKDNTGYDLKQLLIGGEGTLGVVTAAALKLHPVNVSRGVAFCAVATPQAAVELLSLAKEQAGGAIEAFELINRQVLELAIRHIPGVRDPLTETSPWYVLAEFSSAEPGSAEAAMERCLGEGLERGQISDAAIAQTEGQAAAFWHIRESLSAAQKPEGAGWKHDVAVPVSRVAEMIEAGSRVVLALVPDARIAAFGHVGDGNIHFNIVRPAGGDEAAFDALRDAGAHAVHDVVMALDGSISAEHGLGSMKTEEARHYKSPVEVAAMAAIRLALDPKRIMNPRVLF
jgi:FAD/FMN-containing dehydrogenase